jgi:hypothetical protein
MKTESTRSPAVIDPLPVETDPDDPTQTIGDPRDYDPADYRWVPVRRVPRFDGWTEEKQRRFIEVLADTGQVRLACDAVKLSRESAYKLRRAPGRAAFARAWDAARLHAAHAIEDIAFERAIEGTEHPVFNLHGEEVGVRRRYDPRLLMFLLRHLKPETYGHDALAAPPPAPPPMETVLRALEPALPGPPEDMVAPGELFYELDLADLAGGELPHFMDEQRVETTDPWAALSPQEQADFEYHLEQAKKETAFG